MKKEIIYLLSFFSLGSRYHLGSLVWFFYFFFGETNFVVFWTQNFEIFSFFSLGVNCKLDYFSNFFGEKIAHFSISQN